MFQPNWALSKGRIAQSKDFCLPFNVNLTHAKEEGTGPACAGPGCQEGLTQGQRDVFVPIFDVQEHIQVLHPSHLDKVVCL